MIIIYHNKNKVVEVVVNDAVALDAKVALSVAETLFLLAEKHPKEILVWCHIELKNNLNLTQLESLFPHKKAMLSFNPNSNFYLEKGIGYVEQSVFINVNKAIVFPTWQMSSLVGSIYAETLLTLKDSSLIAHDFDYFLHSLGKLAMPKGLLCYSEPQLVKQPLEVTLNKTSKYILFRFVKQHYKTQWTFMLLLNFFIYERKFPLLPFLICFFFKNRTGRFLNFESIQVVPSLERKENPTFDVIIPTIGRKKYLYDVLCDLKVQTQLPKKVIIVEQNPTPSSVTELDYIENESWPFEIKAIFTHQTGACNARNLAMEQVQSEWVFFADDDIRFATDLIQKTFENISGLKVKAFTLSCLQARQKQTENQIKQWNAFGSGCSFVWAKSLKNCSFDRAYEFGFGEDSDFGMQIRNQGYDILYLPEPKILHLKAPIGGFRTKPILRWHDGKIQPKPSPTVMLYKMQHDTKSQLLGYKTTLFFKYYRVQTIKNPVNYYVNFQKQWKQSVFWATKLKSI